MLRSVYHATLRLAEHPRALPALGAVSFAESSVFPIPPDVMMVPMILARPKKAWLIAFVATVTSVLGGVFGYVIGAFFFEHLGMPILTGLGKGDAIAEFNNRFNDFGFWAVLIAGLTPFPFKVITIMSGWAGMPLWTFLFTALIARGLRFFIVAGLLFVFGEPIRDFIERRLALVFSGFIILILAGFLVIQWL